MPDFLAAFLMGAGSGHGGVKDRVRDLEFDDVNACPGAAEFRVQGVVERAEGYYNPAAEVLEGAEVTR